MRRPSIVVYQRDPIYGSFIQEALQKDFSITMVQDRKEIMRSINSGRYDCMVIDLDLEASVLQDLFEHFERQNVKLPVVAMSENRANLECLDSLRKLGIKSFILKSQLRQQLAQRLATVLYEGPDKRQNSRAYITLPIEYTTNENEALKKSQTVSLSVGGVFVRSMKPAKVNSYCDIALHIPEKEALIKTRVKVLYNVTSSVPGAAPHPQGIAFGFVNLGAQDASLIQETIQSHA